MAKSLKMIALNYDLDDELLKKHYPNPKSYKNAWRDVKGFLCKHGFEDRQYSGVISSTPMSSIRAKRIFNMLLTEYGWLEPCIQKFDITKFENELSLIDEWRDNHFIENVNKIDLNDPLRIANEGHKVLSNDKTNKDTIIDKSLSKNDKSKTK